MADLSRRALLTSAGVAAIAAALPVPSGEAAPFRGIIIDDPLRPPPRPLPTLAELKDWSERALAALQKHWPEHIYGEVFLSDGDSSHGHLIRCECPRRTADFCFRCSSALPGTPMIGAMSGYYEPEWDETTAYGVLQDVVGWNEKPAAMTDAEWADALAIVGWTPATHAERMAALAHELGEMVDEWKSENGEAAGA